MAWGTRNNISTYIQKYLNPTIFSPKNRKNKKQKQTQNIKNISKRKKTFIRKKHKETWWFKVTLWGWLSDPFQWLSDLQLGDEKVTDWITWNASKQEKHPSTRRKPLSRMPVSYAVYTHTSPSVPVRREICWDWGCVKFWSYALQIYSEHVEHSDMSVLGRCCQWKTYWTI